MIKDVPFGLLTEPLLSWYFENARELPWRSDPSPYRVWISEIMLQQTRVEAVRPYFERFIRELPGIAELSRCPEDRLLKLWEGLGYYSRARSLKETAVRIMEEYDGRMPEEYEELLSLKGIGPYTAGAISSIAFGKRAAAVDGNVFRIVTRLGKDDTDITKPSFRKEITELLCEAMPEGNCGAFNQALMDLGATVCVPNGEPKCGECPVREFCLARKDHSECAYPVKPEKKKRRIEEKTVLLIRDGKRIILQKRPDKGLLAGMYEFPNAAGHLD
ncbi:MAG: A/G-specific adenine glycosylase, partial [Lachnospiraceae bacterium]|nr:A/G-specific adenine glycosylase [Lachnospiraceae bacterium]